MIENIPQHAQRVSYHYGPRLKGFYWIWLNERGRWVWSALGNSGEKPNKTMALQAAYDWIVNNRID